MNIKEELLKKCHLFVNNRLQTIQYTISSNQAALQSETKSSAGDKHETGRAMLQLEMEKAGQQLANIQQMKEVLVKIDPSKSSNIIRLGSIVKTTQANFFIAVSVGKITIENVVYFAISPSSPIGKQLLGKKEKEKFNFKEKQISIQLIK